MSDNLQKLGALAFALVAITASVTAISNTLSPESRILIPILGNESVLSGQVSTSSIPINDYTASQTAASVIIKADEHNFVTCNNGGSVGTRIHDFGRVPTWAYEFTGNEPPFTGDFWVSPGELASNPQYNSINTLNTFKEGKRYYIMSAKDLRYQCGEGLKLSEYCGDSICQNSEDTNSCNEDCNQCGDGVVGGLEACDDGNSLDQDGCNAYCQAEPGYGCTGNPSDCNLLIPTLPGQGGSSSPGSSSSTSTSQAQTCTYSPIGSKDDVFVKGTATFNGQSSTDFCVSDTVLAEYSCSFGFMEGLTHNCEFGCADGACNRPPDDIASLRISIDGPQSTTYLPGTQNAVLGKVNFEKGGSPMNIENLFILVQGTTEDFNALNGRRSSSTDEIHEILEGVELYNMTTGESKAGSRLTGSQSMGHKTTGSDKGTYQIYRFDNIVVNQNSEDWEFRTDFQENITNGDKFRINICGEPTHVAEGNNVIRSFTKCDFGGLIDPVTTYQLRVIDDTTGNLISTIFPRGNIASNFHTVFDGSGGNPGPGPGPSGSPGNPGPGPETHTECRDSQCVVVSGLGNDQCSSSSDCSDLVPKAFITQKATGTSNTATENQKDISLLRFEAFASSEDLLIAKAEFEEQQGDLRDLQNYALWVDTDGNNLVDTILEDGVTFQGGRISFGNLAGGGYVLPANQAIAFEVHGDVSSSLSEDKIQLRFEIGLDDYLHLEALDDGENLNGIKTDDGACRGGVSGGCDITVSTVDSIVWNFSSQGSLFVTKDNTPLRQRQLLGGELGAEVLRLEFHAEDEDIDVTDIRFMNSVVVNSLDRLELYIDGGVKIGEATRGGCAGAGGNNVFCANMESQQFVIPKGDDVDLLVRPLIKRDTHGGRSNETIQLSLFSPSSNAPAIEARGASSSNDLSQNNGDSTANGEIFIGTEFPGQNGDFPKGEMNSTVLAKFSSVEGVKIPDANDGTPPAVPIGDDAEIGAFTFTAASHNNSENGDNDAILNGIIFNVNATNVPMKAQTFRLYNKSDGSFTSCKGLYPAGQEVDGTNISGNFFVQCIDLSTSTLNTEIDDGNSETFTLNVDITQSIATTSKLLQVSLQDFDQAGATLYRTFGFNTSHIQWYDKDQSSTEQFNWIEYPETSVKSTSYRS